MLGVLTADMADPCQVNTGGKEVNSQDYTALDVWRLYVFTARSANKCREMHNLNGKFHTEFSGTHNTTRPNLQRGKRQFSPSPPISLST